MKVMFGTYGTWWKQMIYAALLWPLVYVFFPIPAHNGRPWGFTHLINPTWDWLEAHFGE